VNAVVPLGLRSSVAPEAITNAGSVVVLLIQIHAGELPVPALDQDGVAIVGTVDAEVLFKGACQAQLSEHPGLADFRQDVGCAADQQGVGGV